MIAKVETFLSPNVHHLLCELIASEDIRSTHIITDNNQDDVFDDLSCLLKGNKLDTRDDYIKAVRDMVPYTRGMHEYYMSKEHEDLFHGNSDLFKWLSRYSSFPKEISLRKNSVRMMLLLLKLTSTLERALGDIYVLSGRTCPFLLRDLLSTVELKSLFGETRMKILKILMGSPYGLNLRNLAWHGFLVPTELPYVFVALLLFVCESMASEVHKAYPNWPTCRPVISKSNSLELLVEVFQGTAFTASQNLLAGCMQGFEMVSPLMMPFFKEAFVLYERARYGDCLVMLLPLLENVLRCVFAVSNVCEHRILTAETSALYTTLDEVLSQFLDDGSINKVRSVLGDNLMVLLMDIFFMLDGPRLRDRISHGEMALEVISRSVTNFMICILVRVSLSLRPTEAKVMDGRAAMPASTFASYPYLRKDPMLSNFEEKLDNYQSLFHPLAVTKRICRECIEKISTLQAIPFPQEFGDQITSDPDSEHEGFKNESQIEAWCKSTPNLSETLFMADTREMEVVVILRHTSEECSKAASAIVNFLRTRWQSYHDRSLRSRQRANYKRLIARLPSIKSFFWRILKTLSQYFIAIVNRQDWLRNHDSSALRKLKAILKTAENLRAMTLQNKWDEVCLLLLASWQDGLCSQVTDRFGRRESHLEVSRIEN